MAIKEVTKEELNWADTEYRKIFKEMNGYTASVEYCDDYLDGMSYKSLLEIMIYIKRKCEARNG